MPSTDSEIRSLALPAMAALAADPLLSLVDTALVGRLGAVPLAALGVSAAVFGLVFVVCNFLTYGTTAEVARMRGAGAPEEAARHALQALWLALGIGALITVVLVSFAGPVLAAMGASGPVTGPALDYTRVRGLAAVPVLVVMVGHGAFRGLKDTRTPLTITVLANGGNAALSWVLIHAAGLGVVGAAYGTLVAQVAAATAFLVLGRRALAPPDLRVEPQAMRRIVRVSRDLFLRTLSLVSALLVTTAVAARMGTTTVAAHQVARELWLMMTLVLDGFAIAGQAMVGTALGAARPEVARRVGRRLIAWGLGAGTLVGAGYLALAGLLPRVFTTDEAVLAEIASVWLLIALLQPVGGVVFVLDGVLMGAADYRFLLWSTAGAALVALVPVSLAALWLGWGLVGIWVGMAAMMLVRLATILRRFGQEGWTGQVSAEQGRR